MAVAAILNFQKVLFLTPDDTYTAHMYHHIKFGVVIYAILGILGHIPHFPFRHCHQVGDRPIYH